MRLLAGFSFFLEHCQYRRMDMNVPSHSLILKGCDANLSFFSNRSEWLRLRGGSHADLFLYATAKMVREYKYRRQARRQLVFYLYTLENLPSAPYVRNGVKTSPRL